MKNGIVYMANRRTRQIALAAQNHKSTAICLAVLGNYLAATDSQIVLFSISVILLKADISTMFTKLCDRIWSG
jgi:hypothetical protein